jgi:hypothetical protein
MTQSRMCDIETKVIQGSHIKTYALVQLPTGLMVLASLSLTTNLIRDRPPWEHAVSWSVMQDAIIILLVTAHWANARQLSLPGQSWLERNRGSAIRLQAIGDGRPLCSYHGPTGCLDCLVGGVLRWIVVVDPDPIQPKEKIEKSSADT